MFTRYPFPLSEKTLELNILSSMLQDVRRLSPSSFIYGFSIRLEHRYGLDSTISIPGDPMLLAFQFKKAYYSHGVMFHFYFNNNSYRDQQNFIYATAQRAYPPPTVFYALPALANIHELVKASPLFLQSLYLVDPRVIGPIYDRRTHEIVIDTRTMTGKIYSEFIRKEIKVYSWRDLLEGVKEKKFGMRTEAFLENIRENKEFEVELFSKGIKRRLFLRSLLMPM